MTSQAAQHAIIASTRWPRPSQTAQSSLPQPRHGTNSLLDVYFHYAVNILVLMHGHLKCLKKTLGRVEVDERPVRELYGFGGLGHHLGI
jgi:hypothetical protein